MLVLLRFHLGQDFRCRRCHGFHCCSGEIALLLAVQGGVQLIEQLRGGPFLHGHHLPRMIVVERNAEQMKCAFYAGEVIQLRDRIAATTNNRAMTRVRTSCIGTDLLVLN